MISLVATGFLFFARAVYNDYRATSREILTHEMKTTQKDEEEESTKKKSMKQKITGVMKKVKNVGKKSGKPEDIEGKV